MRDLLLRPPVDNPYTALKEQLTKRTALSEQRRLQQFFTGEELGDRKPTQLLRRIQQLLGDRPGIDPSFMQELFLQRLPQSVRMVLASTPEGTTLTKLAELADKVLEVASLNTHPPTDQTVAPPPYTSCYSCGYTGVAFRDISAGDRSLARSRLPSRPARLSQCSPTPTPASNTSDNSLCWSPSSEQLGVKSLRWAGQRTCRPKRVVRVSDGSGRAGWEGGVVVGDVEEDVSAAMGKSIWAGFSLSVDTESVQPLRSNV